MPSGVKIVAPVWLAMKLGGRLPSREGLGVVPPEPPPDGDVAAALTAGKTDPIPVGLTTRETDPPPLTLSSLDEFLSRLDRLR